MKEAYQKTIEEIYQELDTSKNGLTTKKIKALQNQLIFITFCDILMQRRVEQCFLKICDASAESVT